jgi:hypothetical protein
MAKVKNNFKNRALKAVSLLLMPLLLNTGCARSCGFCPVEDATTAVILGSIELAKNWDLVLENSCIDYDHGIVRLNLEFSSQEIIEICRARFLLVDIVNEYVRRFNEHYVLRNELIERPFGPENMYVLITFESYFGRFVDEQYVNQIRMVDGCVTYYAFTAFDPYMDRFEQHSEFYNNTRLIVQAQKLGQQGNVYEKAAVKTGVPEKPKDLNSYFLKPN